MKNFICLVMLFIIANNPLHAQCSAEADLLQTKYWQLREQFDEHFIKTDLDEDGNIVGDGIGTWDAGNYRYTKAGYSLPVTQMIMKDRSNDGEDVIVNGGFVNGEGEDATNNILNFGADNTYTLGMYIAMLASEYGLLRQNSDPRQEQTLNELYLALQAVRRLDMTANRLNSLYCGCYNDDATPPTASGYTGFLLRSDTPASFHDEIDDDSYSPDWRAGGVRSLFAEELYTDGLPCNFRFGQFGNRIAGQDQIIGLLFGFAFVKKFVPEDVTVFYLEDQKVLQMAQELAHRMVRRIRSHPGRNVCFPSSCPDDGAWGPHIGSDHGAFAKPHIRGMIKLLDYIWPDNDVHANFSDWLAWQGAITLVADGNQPVNDNVRMAIELMAAGNTNFGQQARGEARRSGELNLMQLLAWAVLHNKTLTYDALPAMESILSDLGCEGNCNQPGGYSGPDFECSNSGQNRWCSGERWKHSVDYLESCGPFPQKGSNYDYMLAYNLYHLYEKPNAPYFNPFDEVEEDDPIVNNICGEVALCIGASDASKYSLTEDGEPGSTTYDNITWEASDNITIVEDPTNPYSVEAYANILNSSVGWIAVEFYDGTCRFEYRNELKIGVPSGITGVTESEREVPCGQIIDLVGIAEDDNPNSIFEWTFNGPSEGYEYFWDGKIARIFAENTESATVYYTFTMSNNCGESSFSGSVHVLDSHCGGNGDGPLIVGSPNPADDHLCVELTNVPLDVFANGGHIEYFFLDQYSTVKKTVTSTNLIETINTSDLPNGVYHLLGQLGNQSINNSPTIIIQHQ